MQMHKKAFVIFMNGLNYSTSKDNYIFLSKLFNPFTYFRQSFGKIVF